MFIKTAKKDENKDEDLIILSEEAPVTASLEDIKLDAEDTAEDSEIITFDTEELQDVKEEIKLEVAEEEEVIINLEEDIVEETSAQVTETSVGEEKAPEIDFSLDLGASEEAIEVAEAPVVEEKAEEAVDFGGFDLSEGVSEDTTVVSETAEVATVVGSVASMDAILEETVSKLEARKETIALEKSGKTAKVVDLDAEIEKLKDEKIILEWEIDGLDMEAEKISLNIEGLQVMKIGSEEVVKEHNVNRMKK